MTPASPLPITALAFDLGNVLVRVDHLRFCRRLAALVDLSPEEVYAAVFQTRLEPRFDTGRLSSPAFCRRIMGRFRLALPYPRFCALWNEIFDPMEGMEEVVERLGGRYLLLLVSNTNPLHFRYIRQRFPVVRHFRRFILSYRVGSRKPEAGFYQALIREAGGEPAHCLFIDDKPPFVEAARAHGLLAWHFTSPQEFKQEVTRHGLW